MSLPFWIEDVAVDSLWDSLFLGGTTWPGVAIVEPEVSRSIDVAKQANLPPTLTDKGYNPGKVKVQLVMWNLGQWEDFQEVIPNFHPRKANGLRYPLDILHPATSVLGIDTVYLEKISTKHPSDQVYTVTLELLEWFPETKPGTKVQGFDGTSKSGAPLNPKDFEVATPNSGANL
jgi:hypothetical protein